MLVTFKIRHATTKPGESAFIVGNTEEFGNWIVSIFDAKAYSGFKNILYNSIFPNLLTFHFLQNKAALPLETNAQHYPTWTASKPIKVMSAEQAKDIQYKYII